MADMDLADWTDLDDAYLVTFGHHPDIDVDQISPFRVPPGPGRRWLLARRHHFRTDEENEQLDAEAEPRARPPQN